MGIKERESIFLVSFVAKTTYFIGNNYESKQNEGLEISIKMMMIKPQTLTNVDNLMLFLFHTMINYTLNNSYQILFKMEDQLNEFDWTHKKNKVCSLKNLKLKLWLTRQKTHICREPNPNGHIRKQLHWHTTSFFAHYCSTIISDFQKWTKQFPKRNTI